MAHCHDGTDELDRRFGNRDFVGLVFNRYGSSWIGRQTANATGVGDITYACRHRGLIHRFSSWGHSRPAALLYLAAVAGAAITIWLWRGR